VHLFKCIRLKQALVVLVIERRLFARLAVFAGDFTLTDAPPDTLFLGPAIAGTVVTPSGGLGPASVQSAGRLKGRRWTGQDP
jgi:hypothetical protein